MHKLTSFALRHPRIALAGIVLVTTAMVPGLLRLRSDASYHALLGADHPAVERLDRFLEEFGGLPILVLWSCDPGDPCAHALDDASLAMASRLSAELEGVPGVSSVRGPTTSPLLVPSEDGFAVRYLEEGEDEGLAGVTLPEMLPRATIRQPRSPRGGLRACSRGPHRPAVGRRVPQADAGGASGGLPGARPARLAFVHWHIPCTTGAV